MRFRTPIRHSSFVIRLVVQYASEFLPPAGREFSGQTNGGRRSSVGRKRSNTSLFTMNPHYIVLADHGHLRIFEQRSGPGQNTPGLVEVRAFDFPQGRASYTEHDTDFAGRFQSSKQQGRGPGAPTARIGMSVDERLPKQNEVQRRTIGDVAEAINGFIEGQPDATWDFAAPPSAHNAIVEQLLPKTRQRLQKSIAKDLVHQPTTQLLEQLV
jgi:hypothetical protein